MSLCQRMHSFPVPGGILVKAETLYDLLSETPLSNCRMFYNQTREHTKEEEKGRLKNQETNRGQS